MPNSFPEEGSLAQNVMVFLYSEDYRQHGTWSFSLQQRLAILQGTLGRCQNWITSHAKELTAAPFKGIYLAPEYYLTRPNQWNQREPMGEAMRVRLEPDLLSLSARFPEILIVPGTVFYAKSMVRTAESFQFKFDPTTGTRTLPKTKDADRRERFQQKLRTHIDTVFSLKTDDDPEFYTNWKKQGYDADGFAVPALKALKASLKDTQKTPSILRNSAYVLLGGRRIAKYDKQTDWGEALGNSPDSCRQDECPNQIKNSRLDGSGDSGGGQDHHG